MSDTVVKSNESLLSLTNHRPSQTIDHDNGNDIDGDIDRHQTRGVGDDDGKHQLGDVLAAIDKSHSRYEDDDDVVSEDMPPLPPLPPPSPDLP